MAVAPTPFHVSRHLPKDARERLIAAAVVDSNNQPSVLRESAINQAIRAIQSKYPQFFKEQQHGHQA